MTPEQKAAMRQALEALKECRCDPRLKYEHPNYDNIITALRRALAVSETHKQPAYRAVKTVHEGKAYYVSEPEQPAQQQEPVAWIVEDKYGERLEWAADADMGWGNKTEPLYTSPSASKPWVGLTVDEVWKDDDVMALNAEMGLSLDQMMELVEWANAKLREKNNG